MKLTRKRHKILAWGLLALLLIIGAFMFAMWFNTLRVGAPQDGSSVGTAGTSATTKPEAVTLKLPHTAPIVALKENYNDDTSLWRVVSKDYPLSNSRYVPANLQLATVPSRTDKSSEERSLRKDIMPQTETLFTALENAGFEMMIGSGYRSYEQQNIYYTNYVKTYGQERADSFSARPGQSEHQTGLAFDIAYKTKQCYLEACFGDTDAGRWLAAHAYEYGFILRYPKDKTSVTKYIYEPWHFRYVGKDLAKALHESGLTLDEARPYLQDTLKDLGLGDKVTD